MKSDSIEMSGPKGWLWSIHFIIDWNELPSVIELFSLNYAFHVISYRIQVKNIVQEFSTTIVTVFPEYRRLMKYIETCVIFSKHMGPRKWRRSFTTTLFLPLTETKAEMFPKMSM